MSARNVNASQLLDLYEEGSDDHALVTSALELAERYHAGQKRASGEPFVSHPIAVAKIVADEGMSAETVAAALCHDLLEDTKATRDELSKELTPAAADLVDGVTKVSEVYSKPEAVASVETFRKLIVAAADDARVLVIKIADRLHNTRTIHALREERQRAICEETMEIYAPLARRLGMSLIARELEDLSLKVTDPAAYAEAASLQRELASREDHTLSQLESELRARLEAISDPPLSEFKIKQRVKSVYSLAQKLKRRNPDELQDVLGLRIIISSEPWECYRALAEVHSLWTQKPGSFDDYIGQPKSSLYQSLHTTVITSDGALVEIQIRTEEMDEIAEHGIAAHWAYKESLSEGGPRTTRRYIQRLAANQQQAGEIEDAFEALRADVFKDEIYVFTPQGDVKILPAGASVIDFAYAIHSEIGDRALSARVDGVFSPLGRRLKSGERVEINTGGEARQPSDGWLDDVVTARARNRIRARLYELAGPGSEETERGFERLLDAARSGGLELDEAGLRKRLEALPEYQSAEHAAAQADRDKGRARQIITQLLGSITPTRSKRKQAAKTPRPRPTALKLELDQVWVSGERLRSGAWHLAGCCLPRPGDEIVAYVTATRGTAIHSARCENVAEALQAGSRRVLPAEWGSMDRAGDSELTGAFQARVTLAYTERPGLLSQLAKAIYGAGSELNSLRLESNGSVVRGEIGCLVGSDESLEQLIERLREIPEALQISVNE